MLRVLPRHGVRRPGHPPLERSNTMKKRLISVLMCLCLALCLFPAAQAAGQPDYSDDCIEFIKEHEGFADSVYDDGTGWYIGYGSSVNAEAKK